ncbi:unnamed protein product [Effrenium voratum]|uniref:Uncharacterized protein n=1 Tax=Effrenium voratum TaxID=2562239 RepID=A0AA36I4G4_9DINO|nr:unnamed protein product [Effrenium voratum]CAJ1380847.1 unnamed protein product [Effrenium voratum]
MGPMADPRREGRALTQEMVFMRTKCNRMDLIKNLNLWGNDLQDISVIQCMPNLEVLSLSVNQVSTLVDLQHCPRLSELYLRKNEIVDLSEILYLRRLRRMKVLWLADNPCADLPYYRQYILHHLPGLTKIDAEDVTEEERREAQMLDFAGLETNGGDGPAEDYAEEYDSAGRRRAGSEDMEALARAQAQEELRRVQSSPVDRLSASRPHERRPLGYRQEESPEHTGQGRAAYRSAPLREPLLEDEDLIEQRRVPQRRPTRPEQRGSRTDLPPTGMREANWEERDSRNGTPKQDPPGRAAAWGDMRS